MSDGARHTVLALGLVSSAVLALLALGCGAKTILVTVPPRIALTDYNTIGVIEFASDPADKLNQVATQHFVAMVQESQPGVRFLEIGPMDRVLRLVGREQLDPETMKLVGSRYGVETVFTGGYEISSVKPKLTLGQDLSSASASARVRISLSVRHWDTRSGATLWTRAHWGEWPLARITTGQPISLTLSDPRDRYAAFLQQLAYAVTEDFRAHQERREVAKQ